MNDEVAENLRASTALLQAVKEQMAARRPEVESLNQRAKALEVRIEEAKRTADEYRRFLTEILSEFQRHNAAMERHNELIASLLAKISN